MDEMNLKDFRPDMDLDSDNETLKQKDSDISSSIHSEEINTLKIDKLSNRVTIISIIIPCHRVIGANGKLVGYGGGLHRKQALLDLESSVQH